MMPARILEQDELDTLDDVVADYWTLTSDVTIEHRDPYWDLLASGWHLVPLLPSSKVPAAKLAPRGHLSATTDTTVVERWLEQIDGLNLGVACEQSGLVVIDVDYRYGGEQAFRNHRHLLPDTYQVETGDGFHLYYRAPRGLHLRGKLTEGIDVKYRGYVVAAGSVHPNGTVYAPAGGDLIDAPAALLDAITKPGHVY
jgi:hypothetical protein